MVKNTTGGNKSKGFARKNVTGGASSSSTNSIRFSKDPAEVYAQVLQIHGGAMCEVENDAGVKYLCHIRGKFRGRGKRDNFISRGTWILVGLREWENGSTTGKRLNCDLIEVYKDADKSRLKSSVNAVNWDRFIANDLANSNPLGSTKADASGRTSVADNVVFTDSNEDEYHELIDAQLAKIKTDGSAPVIGIAFGEDVVNDDGEDDGVGVGGYADVNVDDI